MKNSKAGLKEIYLRLLAHFGPQGWWPAVTRFEMIAGAILTQNTSWKNVEKAIARLKKAKALTPNKMYALNGRKLADIIKPAGYFNVKAARLGNFLEFLFTKYGGSLARLAELPTYRLRRELLSVSGIGQETCDSILLYAFKRPVFVVDAYTKRIFYRHLHIKEGDDYARVQKRFMSRLPREEELYNEYHALIVRIGKDFCLTRPRCEGCPLGGLPHKKLEIIKL